MIFRYICICLLTILLMQVLKSVNPSGALLLLLGAVLVVSVWGMNSLRTAFSGLEQLIAQAGLSSGLYIPILKVVGIAATVKIVGAVCKDAGASALATQLELLGVCAALLTCFPLFEQVLGIANALLE